MTARASEINRHLEQGINLPVSFTWGTLRVNHLSYELCWLWIHVLLHVLVTMTSVMYCGKWLIIISFHDWFYRLHMLVLGNQEYLRLWEKFRDISISEYKKLYKVSTSFGHIIKSQWNQACMVIDAEACSPGQVQRALVKICRRYKGFWWALGSTHSAEHISVVSIKLIDETI